MSVLRLGGARLLDERDGTAVRSVLNSDPVACCMVAAKVEAGGIRPAHLGGELWGLDNRPMIGGRLEGMCFSGPNLIPLHGNASAMRAFADRALRRRRVCSSVVGPAELVLELWSELRPEWGPAREIRANQPLLATDRPPAVQADLLVRPVRPEELDRYMPAAIAMFMEEIGIDPCVEDGGSGYRARVAEQIAAGRVFARFEDGEVVFKAEIGALSAAVGQVQGVWVRPDRRGHGLGTRGTASVVERLVKGLGRTASLYVNAFNVVAHTAYRRIGFREVGRYATILF